jgi:hypothetical protein
MFIFSDQYDSKAQNKSGLPLCSDPVKALKVNNAERNALITNSEVLYNCPPPCIKTEFKGSVIRFQSGVKVVYVFMFDVKSI